MSNDNKEYKNSEPCKEKQEARELTTEELEGVSGGVTFDKNHARSSGGAVISPGNVELGDSVSFTASNEG